MFPPLSLPVWVSSVLPGKQAYIIDDKYFEDLPCNNPAKLTDLNFMSLLAAGPPIFKKTNCGNRDERQKF